MRSAIKRSLQNFAMNRALNYLEGNPENIPKLMAMVDKHSPRAGIKGREMLFAM